MKNFILLLLLVFSIQANAQTLVVSDIDDTIKLANIKDFTESARYAFDDESRFLGMSELYNLIKLNQYDSTFVYLSRAPQWLMQRTHLRFLDNGGFPTGFYIGRSEYSGDAHKVTVLRQLMKKMKPQRVIMFGDNGEKDAEVYATIAKENPSVEFIQFIRTVYSIHDKKDPGARLYEGQIGFISPIEIAFELENKNILKTASVKVLVEEVSKRLIVGSDGAEGEIAFPYYMNCSDFVWKWQEKHKEFPILKTLEMRIADRCYSH